MSTPASVVIDIDGESRLQCRFCPVKFSGSPTNSVSIEFRDRHEQVNHNPRRTYDLREAGKRTARRLAKIQEERAAKLAERQARLAAEAARKTAHRKYLPVKVRSIPKARVKKA